MLGTDIFCKNDQNKNWAAKKLSLPVVELEFKELGHPMEYS